MTSADDDWRRVRRIHAPDVDGAARKAGRNASRTTATSDQRSREVIVRVTGRTRSVRALGAQLLYNTRHGVLEAEHSNGGVLRGEADLLELRDRWALDNAVLARHPSCTTQSVGVVLSMPAGTLAEAVRAAALGWAHEHLTARTEWLATLHQDREHPHAHVAVRAVENEGLRLEATPAEVQRWRESFAQRLQVLGIEADATPRREKIERLMRERDQGHSRIPEWPPR